MATKIKIIGLLSALLLLGMGVSSKASACYYASYYGGGYFGATYYAAYTAFPYAYAPSGLYDERPPYFSYFTPIYYQMDYGNSRDSVRSSYYGQSAAPADPLRIQNPYVGGESAQVVSHVSPKAHPPRIRNSYVDSKVVSVH
ncbi:MAG TPA: hypothetical protein VJL29_03815 [Thermoguttaceae bacterium]|nr:hypothetical protein [Thermoguttaceae bacterium]